MDGWFQSRRIISPDVAHGQVLPGLIADVLPAGDFLKHQQADLVAAVEEVRRLRVVRRAHDVALQLLLQDEGIAPLHARGHGAADVRETSDGDSARAA